MKVLDRLEEVLIAFLISAATVVIFAAVVHRFLASWAIPGVQQMALNINMSWAQELCIYMFVWMAKFGAAYGVRTGIHVGVDLLVNMLARTGAPQSHPVRAARRCALHRHRRRAWDELRLGERRALRLLPRAREGPRRHLLRPHDAGPGVADVDRVFGDSAGLGVDVLPLPPGRCCVRARTRSCPSHDHGHVEGIEGEDDSIRTTCRRLAPPTRTRVARAMSTIIIISLLIALMISGMPISIALGLLVVSVPVHVHAGADRIGGAEAVHRHREVCRDHGDPVLVLPAGYFLTPRRSGAADDPLRDVDGRAPVRRPGALRRARLRAVRGDLLGWWRRRRRWSRSARSCCRRW